MIQWFSTGPATDGARFFLSSSPAFQAVQGILVPLQLMPNGGVHDTRSDEGRLRCDAEGCLTEFWQHLAKKLGLSGPKESPDVLARRSRHSAHVACLYYLYMRVRHEKGYPPFILTNHAFSCPSPQPLTTSCSFRRPPVAIPATVPL